MFNYGAQWLVVVAVVLAGCDQKKKPVIKAPVETWVSQKYKSWPQIVLTNDATFNGHTPMQGASSFLIKASDGRVFAVTAKHLLGPDGGVNPPVEPRQFNKALVSWKLAPRTIKDSFVEVDKLVAYGTDEEEDWLVFSLKSTAGMGSRPLRVRGDPVEKDDTVYLLGCPYARDNCKQDVYPGHVKGLYKQEIMFEVPMIMDLSGFSGAPVIDNEGHLVGILTGRTGGFPNYGKAQSAEGIYQWLESSSSKSGF